MTSRMCRARTRRAGAEQGLDGGADARAHRGPVRAPRPDGDRDRGDAVAAAAPAALRIAPATEFSAERATSRLGTSRRSHTRPDQRRRRGTGVPRGLAAGIGSGTRGADPGGGPVTRVRPTDRRNCVQCARQDRRVAADRAGSPGRALRLRTDRTRRIGRRRERRRDPRGGTRASGRPGATQRHRRTFHGRRGAGTPRCPGVRGFRRGRRPAARRGGQPRGERRLGTGDDVPDGGHRTRGGRPGGRSGHHLVRRRRIPGAAE